MRVSSYLIDDDEMLLAMRLENSTPRNFASAVSTNMPNSKASDNLEKNFGH